jgi:hypothetical protein
MHRIFWPQYTIASSIAKAYHQGIEARETIFLQYEELNQPF